MKTLKSSQSIHLLPLILVLMLPGFSQKLGAQVFLTGGNYTQNFNQTSGVMPAPSIPASGTTSFSWENNNSSPSFYGLPGWYSSVGSGAVNGSRTSSGSTSGSGNTIYFWGAASSSERAFSTFSPSGFSGDTYLGLQFRNDTGSTITAVDISYAVEQWRRQASAATTLSLQYLVTNSTGDQLTAAGYSTLNLSGTNAVVTAATGTAGGGLIGTTTANLSLTGLNWASGNFLWLRWVNSPNGSPSVATSALAVDDFSLAVVPEPSTLTLVGLGIIGALLMRRRIS